MSEFKPWAWAVIDHSTAILHEADKDIEDGCIMAVHPCRSCIDRNKDKEWQWGLCTTPTKKYADLIESAPELLEALQKVRSKIDGLNIYDIDCDEIDAALRKALGK